MFLSTWLAAKVSYLNTVEPLLNSHPRGNGLWPLERGWPLNRGRNNRKTIIGTFWPSYSDGCLIDGHLIGVRLYLVLFIKNMKFEYWLFYYYINKFRLQEIQTSNNNDDKITFSSANQSKIGRVVCMRDIKMCN